MRKLSIKEIIEFRRKSDKSKQTFVVNLKMPKEKKDTDGGGDYWVSCLSTISNGYRNNDHTIIIDKIHELEEKYERTDYKMTKDMYKRNIAILYKFEDFDFNKWIPSEECTIVKKHKSDFLLDINGLQIQAVPHHVFTFQNSKEEEIGAIWFIAKLKGYHIDELAMFTDILYRYLNKNFSKDYIINPKYCIAVDVVNVLDVNYSQILKGEIPLKLDSTIEEMKKLM
jgi:hypothetical protein